MGIYHLPDYLKFIKNERKTLRFLADNPFINKEFNTLAKSANVCFYKMAYSDRLIRNNNFVFGCNFDIVIEHDIRKIVIEAKVCPGFSIATYVLSICEKNEAPYCLIRKFHFDYAKPNTQTDPKPVYHIQYGGEQSPELKELEINVEILQPWLSTPRIVSAPINLALLLDRIFFEFRTEETIRLVGRKEWREFIKGNEDEILKPFYESITRFFNSDHKYSFLFRDFNYGIEKNEER